VRYGNTDIVIYKVSEHKKWEDQVESLTSLVRMKYCTSQLCEVFRQGNAFLDWITLAKMPLGSLRLRLERSDLASRQFPIPPCHMWV
jgi:hypothetical protein